MDRSDQNLINLLIPFIRPLFYFIRRNTPLHNYAFEMFILSTTYIIEYYGVEIVGAAREIGTQIYAFLSVSLSLLSI